MIAKGFERCDDHLVMSPDALDKTEDADSSSVSPLLPRYTADPEKAISSSPHQSIFARFFSQRLQGFCAAVILFLALPFARL